MQHVGEVPASAEACVRKAKWEQVRVFQLTGGTLGPVRIVLHVAGTYSRRWRARTRSSGAAQTAARRDHDKQDDDLPTAVWDGRLPRRAEGRSATVRALRGAYNKHHRNDEV
jgi:hypothetical protein